ncbi:hypothetical protein [Szabonella alba]|uniref:Excalibur calcium-binding domain-containing protein n=1 Tax=Szabonella alba TaxID=2804194 RepID=A0A8K0XZJ2_9RHOB|nr:hypothetical protein [Szabonella alba]MBL4916113.1 hypothetical protein [Szabonella alba]
MSAPKALLALALLAACAPAVPDSGAGVGFGDYSDYLRQQEAQRQAPVATGAAPVFSTERIGAALDGTGSGASASSGGPAQGRMIGDLSGSGTAQQATRPRGDAPLTIQPQSGEMNPGSARISDEQNFDAVAARETIESDAERLARQRAQYQVIAPTALPERTNSGRPNIVQFALSTRHNPGTQVYNRSSLFQRNSQTACARFASPDLAQEEFLSQGGPERDRLGVDPDGDGFACGWDPRPFRNALN